MKNTGVVNADKNGKSDITEKLQKLEREAINKVIRKREEEGFDALGGGLATMTKNELERKFVDQKEHGDNKYDDITGKITALESKMMDKIDKLTNLLLENRDKEKIISQKISIMSDEDTFNGDVDEQCKS